MREVTVGRAVRRGLLIGTVLATCVAPAFAQVDNTQRTTEIRRLGGTTRFSPPLRDVDALRSMVNANRTEISRVLTMAGIGDVTTQLLSDLSSGSVIETTIAPGTHMEWMALKRLGKPDLLRNVRWAGRTPFDAYQVRFDYGGYTYTFVVPKVCGNLSLVSRIAVPVTTTAEAPRPVPPPPPPPEPPPPPPQVVAAPPPPLPVPLVVPEPSYRWVATGYLGSAYSTSVNDFGDDEASLTFGGQLAYLWRDKAGAELLADFAPRMGLDHVVDAGYLLQQHHHINAYMANFIGAIPLGGERYQPYLSGGVGAIQFNGDVVDPNNIGFTTSESTSVFGWNLGVGAMGFADRWGVRGDVRYYKGHGDDAPNVATASDISTSLVSGIKFWRANIGLAFRW